MSCFSYYRCVVIVKNEKFKKTVDSREKLCYYNKAETHGGVAHLGERLNGIQEVRGSIPLISTKKALISREIKAFLHISALMP